MFYMCRDKRRNFLFLSRKHNIVILCSTRAGTKYAMVVVVVVVVAVVVVWVLGGGGKSCNDAIGVLAM